MKRYVNFGMFAAMLLGATLLAAGQQKSNAPVLGTWKGESLCTVKPSACHDESVVYEITPGKNGGVVWKADKIVNGQQENMGTLDCTFAASVLTCDISGKGVWSLTVRGDAMTGTLKLSDGTLFRKVSVKRMP